MVGVLLASLQKTIQKGASNLPSDKSKHPYKRTTYRNGGQSNWRHIETPNINVIPTENDPSASCQPFPGLPRAEGAAARRAWAAAKGSFFTALGD